MNDFCALVELTETELYAVAGGRSHNKGSSVKVDIDIDIDVTSKPRTHIENAVDNSVNIGSFN